MPHILCLLQFVVQMSNDRRLLEIKVIHLTGIAVVDPPQPVKNRAPLVPVKSYGNSDQQE